MAALYNPASRALLPHPRPIDAMDVKTQLSITNLMSPPEMTPLEHFQPPAMLNTAMEKHINAPLSPPISPYKAPSNTISPVTFISPVARDPILYPLTDVSSPPPVPLFSDHPRVREVSLASQVVDNHIAALPKSRFRKTTPPRREDYELTLAFKSNVLEQYSKDPEGWLTRERAILRADQDARKAAGRRSSVKLTPLLPARPVVHELPSIRVNTTRIEKSPAIKPRPRISRPAPLPLDNRVATATPRRSLPVLARAGRASITPERTARPSREDKDFEAVVDYCPPLSTLPNRAHCLKVDWKGSPLDLSADPHRHLLHPEELNLASSLRLDCATYLTNKRRLFEHRVQCAKMPKEFRKTDAQQACKIDVNKASKLWTAFDKVGWLDLHHFRHLL